jgi:polyphosphate kinase
MDSPDLKASQNYINRELSFLEFNQRVLAQAFDESVPLLERLRFLCISSSNLDEFFEIRVAGLKQLLELGSGQFATDTLSLQEQLAAIHQRAMRLCNEQYRCLNEVLLPALQAQGISLQGRAAWSPAAEKWLERYFENEIEPVLSPLGLDPARPFPRIQNKSLNFIVRLRGKDAFGRDSEHAIVQVPRSLPRVVPVPNEGSERTLMLLSVIVRTFVHKLFAGIEVLGCYQFRVTRNSDLFVDEEEIDDLRRALEGELAHRRYGAAVRLETSSDCPEDMVQFLLHQFALTDVDMYRMPGPVNLNRLSAIYDLVQRPDLKYPIFTPGLPKRLVANSDMFAVIRQNDVLLHQPYQSFAPVMDFVRLAAADNQVLAIKQTLYRAGHESPVVDALVAAANAGKDVTVIVELRARFDEEANIELSNRLQEAGAHVMYGVVGYKTHAKVTLVVRREPGGIRRYCHLGTGNYHPKTARAYTDYGILTCNDEIGQDVHELFLQLTSLTQTPKLHKLIQSPFGMHDAVISKLAREAEHARAGRPARVIAKMNALVEPQAIEALYRASCAGVKVDLIIRGVCALRPGVPGVSENIRVRSIVGRFLEHSRVFYFENGGAPEMFCASADWMERNFFRRVEVAFPIQRDTHRERILRDLDLCLRDNTQAWELKSDGSYARVERQPKERLVSAQNELLAIYAVASIPTFTIEAERPRK